MRTSLILLLGGVLYAQAPTKFPLEALHFQGNSHIPADRIVSAAGLKIGAPVDKADFDRARERLLESGAFESVGYSFKPGPTNKGFDATFELVEVATLYPYRFEALPASDDALRAALRQQEPLLGDRIPGTPQVLNRYNAAIRKFFDGKLEATGELNTDSGTLEIVFRQPGERARIAEVNFTGNQAILTALLTQKLSASAVGIAYSEPLLRRLLDSAIRPMYDERGLIQVSFPEVTTKKAATNDGLVVTISVQEGPAFTLGTVGVSGIPADEVTQIAKADDWHKGETVNFANVETSLEKIRKRERTQGYLRVETIVNREILEQDHTVNLHIKVERGPQFTLGKLTIEGLDLIGEPAVRKMWKIEPGQPFQDGYPEAFLNRVRDEGIFDNLGKTHSESNINEDSHTVDVVLTFSGAAAPGKSKDGKRR